MITHQVLSILAIVYISYDGDMFSSKVQRGAEIVAEVFLMLVSALLQQLMVLSYSEEQIEEIEVAIMASLGLFVAMNISYLVVSIIMNCKEAKRKKLLESRRQEYKKYQDRNIEQERKIQY